ncbi:MAG: hypothetical protein ACE5GM_04480 [bacterium]
MEEKYRSVKPGDIVTLSDFQTEMDFGGPTDFEIVRKRHYTHKLFEMICCDLENEQAGLMLMIKEVDRVCELRVYVLDHEGTKKELKEDGWEHWEEDGDRLFPAFSAEIPADESLEEGQKKEDGFLTVTFRQKSFGAFYDVAVCDITGDEDRDNQDSERITTVGEYVTDQEVMNPEAFIEWSGDYEGGWVEVYYGAQVQPSHLEIFSVSNFS